MMLPGLNFTKSTSMSVSFDYAVTDRQDKLIMLRHSQEVKEFILNINFKGEFIVAIFVSSDGNKVYVQDKAQKYNDFISAQLQELINSNHNNLNLMKNHRFFCVPFKKYFMTLLTNIIQQKRILQPEAQEPDSRQRMLNFKTIQSILETIYMSKHLKSYTPENGFDFLAMETRPVILANYIAGMLSMFQCCHMIE